jgi:5-bromo-4-chloroindolyl phosphate hydrolysis protein
MSYVQNMTDLGDKVMGRVTDAIDKEDFRGLSEGIREDFRVFADGMKSDGFNFGEAPSGPKYDINDLDHGGTRQTAGQARQTSGQARQTSGQARQTGRPTYKSKQKPNYGRPNAGPVPFMMKVPSKGRNIALCGIGIFGLLGMMTTFGEASEWQLTGGITSDLVGLLIRGAFMLGFGILFAIGLSGKGITDTFYKYASIIGREEYIDIKDLAEHAGETEGEVKKNINRMITRKMLPHATFDDKGKTLILSSRAYKQYEQAKEASAKAKREKAEEQKRMDAMDPAVATQVRNTVTEGEAFLADLVNAQVRIKDPKMKAQLAAQEKVVRKIFERVQEEPGSVRMLRRFMNQYLPTTKKLIDAYIDIENQPVAGENIKDTKTEIEGAMDTINNAYVVLLDSMYQEVAWDVSSDISAMKTMFQQDGLMDDGMPKAGPFDGIINQ